MFPATLQPSCSTGLPAANGGTSTASNSTSGRYEGADVTCTLNSDANLRSGPATSYEVLTAVPAGFTVTVHSYANGWSCVTGAIPPVHFQQPDQRPAHRQRRQGRQFFRQHCRYQLVRRP